MQSLWAAISISIGSHTHFSHERRFVLAGSTYLQEARVGGPLHDLQKGPRHGALVDAANVGVRARLVVATPRKHGHHLVLLLVHGAILVLAEPSLLLLAHVLERAEKRRRARVQVLRLGELVEAEAVAQQVRRLAHQVHALLYIVQQADVARVVRLVHVGQLERGARVAAVENGKERAVGRHARHEVLVQRVRVELPAGLEIHGADGVEEPRRALAGRVAHLAAVPGVVEEVAGAGLADEPVNGSLLSHQRRFELIHSSCFTYEHVVAAGVVLTPQVISQDDLGPGIGRVAPVAEELGNIFHIPVAAVELMIAPEVIDANQQRLFAHFHDGRRWAVIGCLLRVVAAWLRLADLVRGAIG